MSESDQINFKLLHKGAGHYSDFPASSSYYDVYDEDQLLSTSTSDFLQNLNLQSLDYNELVEHLERPILDGFKNQKNFSTNPESILRDEKDLAPSKNSQEEVQIFIDHNSAVNFVGIPSWRVLKVDYSFSIGLYIIAGVMVSVLFSLPPASSLFFILAGFGLFHQTYLVISRSILGASLGEERYNLSWDQRGQSSPLNFILRGLILTLTGFVLIPLFSTLFKRDLLKEYTGLQLEYNV